MAITQYVVIAISLSIFFAYIALTAKFCNEKIQDESLEDFYRTFPT